MVGENSSSKAVTRVIGISTWWDYLGFPQYNKLVANHTLRPTSQICKFSDLEIVIWVTTL